MRAIRQTTIEVLALGLAGLVIGFGYNQIRAQGSIKPLKNYFAKGAVEGAGGTSHGADVGGNAPAGSGSSDDKSPAVQGQVQHPYKEIKLADVVEVLNDPATEMGINVFVDARSAELYAEGHIPGAVRCDPYEVEACIDDVLEVTLAAEKVIVYCGGGECEDSVFMCRELLAAGLEYEALYLYAGGWSEWIGDDRPVEKASLD